MTNANLDEEVCTNAAKSLCMQLSPYFCIFFYLPARKLSRNAPVERRAAVATRTFLCCLQPARLAVAAKYSMISLRSISLLLAFAAKYCFRRKYSMTVNPAIRQTLTAGSTRPTMTFCSLADFCLLLLSSDQHFHYFRSHIKQIVILSVCKTLGYEPDQKNGRKLHLCTI